MKRELVKVESTNYLIYIKESYLGIEMLNKYTSSDIDFLDELSSRLNKGVNGISIYDVNKIKFLKGTFKSNIINNIE